MAIDSSDMQKELDLRAIELSSSAATVARMLDERMTRHEQDCLEERRQASKSRQEFRAEVAANIGTLRDDMAEDFSALRQDMAERFATLRTEMVQGFTKSSESVSHIHGRINAALLGVIGVLLTTVGFLFVKLLGWA